MLNPLLASFDEYNTPGYVCGSLFLGAPLVMIASILVGKSAAQRGRSLMRACANGITYGAFAGVLSRLVLLLVLRSGLLGVHIVDSVRERLSGWIVSYALFGTIFGALIGPIRAGLSWTEQSAQSTPPAAPPPPVPLEHVTGAADESAPIPESWPGRPADPSS
jgi:hypothetical protein